MAQHIVQNPIIVYLNSEHTMSNPVQWRLPTDQTDSEKLREFRSIHRLSQEELGLLVGRSRSTIASYEGGADCDPAVSGLVRLLKDRPTSELLARMRENREPATLPIQTEIKDLVRFLSEGAQSKSYPVHPDDPNTAWRTEHGVSTKRFKLSTLRTLATVPAADGGFLVGQELRPAIIAPELDGRLSRLGVTYIIADSMKDAQLPILADGQGYWIKESENVAMPQVAMSAISTAWQTVGSSVAISRRVIRQAEDAVGTFARSLVRGIAKEIDRAILHGTGFDGEPRGVLDYDITRVDNATTGGVHFSIADSIETLELNGIDSERLAIVAHPTTKRHLCDISDIDGQRDWIMQMVSANQRPFQTFRGLRAIASDKYTAGRILVGDFSQCVVRLSGEVEIKLLDKHRADGAVECYCFQDVSFEMPFAERAFVEIINVAS